MNKVIIIDDQFVQRESFRTYFELNGYQVRDYESGDLFLEKLDKEYDAKIIFLDYHMPGLNGLETLAKVKELAKEQLPPIIMLTTETEPALKKAGMELGVKAWLVKPVKMEYLGQLVDKLNKKK